MNLPKIIFFGGLFVCFFISLTASATQKKRIISLTNSVVELLYAVEEEHHLVARAEYTQYPSQAKTLPVFKSSVNPSIETLLSFQPDTVITPSMVSSDALSRELTKFSISTISVPDQTIEDFRKTSRMVGSLISQLDKFENYLNEFDEQLNSLQERAHTLPRETAVLLYSSHTPFSSSQGTWVDELLSIANFQNVVRTSSKWPQLKMEYLLSEDPDWIFFAPSSRESLVSMNKDLSRLRKDPVWGKLSAIRNKQAIVLPAGLFHVPGPRMTLAAEALIKARTENKH